jgi:O-antigen/teichoic acid export membrane protein
VQTLGLGILALKILSTNRQVGLFAVALSLQAPGNLFLGSIVNIWAPVVSDLYERGAIERLEDLYQTVNRWVATLSFPIFAALMIAPELFVRLFAGRAGSGAAIVVTLLAIGNLFYVGTGPTGYVLSMTGRPGINAINSATGVAIYIALAAVVAPHHGAAGMAIVDSSVTALVNIARVVEAKLLVGVQPFGKRFLKPVWATLAGAAVLLGDKLAFGTGALVEIAGLALAGIVYVGVLAKLGIDPEERHVFETIKRRAFKRGGNAKASDG